MIGFTKPGSPEQAAVCAYVAAKCGGRGWSPEETSGMVKVTGDRMVGAVVFHDWQPDAGTMCLSAGGERGWLDNRAIYQMHSYAFDQCDCQMVVLQVSEHNRLMRRTAEHFGYTGTRIERLRGRDEAEILYTLTEEAFRASPFTKRAIITGNLGSASSTARDTRDSEAENGKAQGTHTP